jgi:hypothetical protein
MPQLLYIRDLCREVSGYRILVGESEHTFPLIDPELRGIIVVGLSM